MIKDSKLAVREYLVNYNTGQAQIRVVHYYHYNYWLIEGLDIKFCNYFSSYTVKVKNRKEVLYHLYNFLNQEINLKLYLSRYEYKGLIIIKHNNKWRIIADSINKYSNKNFNTPIPISERQRLSALYFKTSTDLIKEVNNSARSHSVAPFIKTLEAAGFKAKT